MVLLLLVLLGARTASERGRGRSERGVGGEADSPLPPFSLSLFRSLRPRPPSLLAEDLVATDSLPFSHPPAAEGNSDWRRWPLFEIPPPPFFVFPTSLPAFPLHPPRSPKGEADGSSVRLLKARDAPQGVQWRRGEGGGVSWTGPKAKTEMSNDERTLLWGLCCLENFSKDCVRRYVKFKQSSESS